MKCAWQAFINLLPVWMRENVDKQGKETLQELRLRINKPPELILCNGTVLLDRIVSIEDLRFCINIASRYSPWTASTASCGYITAPGGHRIGLCGKAVTTDGNISGINELHSLCIRVARDISGIASKAVSEIGSTLIIGRPGSGKTTLLRDLIRLRSESSCVAVVDEREEIFPFAHNQPCFQLGRHTDILSGCSKAKGIDIVLRNMSPDIIAVDEITAQEDCEALLHAGWCGVKLLATAHAGSRDDLYHRPIYRPIIESGIFDSLLILEKDKSWHMERFYS